jgi:biotin carboxyl carrier protein
MLAAPAAPPAVAADGDPFSPWRGQTANGSTDRGRQTAHRSSSNISAVSGRERSEPSAVGSRERSALGGPSIRIGPEGDGYRVAVGERSHLVIVRSARDGALTLEIDGRLRRAVVANDGGRVLVALDGATYAIEWGTGSRGGHRATAAEGTITAAMPGQVVAVYASAGDAVEAGQPLLLLTAMKMELTLSAPHAGRVAAIHVAPGDVVERGQALALVEP